MAINNSWSEGGMSIWDEFFQPFRSDSTPYQWHLLLPVITSALCLAIVYIGWIKPMNLNIDLMELGYMHLNDGTYRTVEHKKLSLRDLVAANQRRRAIGNMPPVYPNGWFALIESDQLPRGEVRHVAALGENFAVMRTTEGEVHVLDAYCPHLGVNMAIGGTVHGNCLECPFHKWRFSGETGACISVPYSASKPPSAKTKRWTSKEVNDFIFVWYHAEGESPAWEIAPRDQVSSGAWRFQGRTDILVSCHIQEIMENGADIGHLDALHGPNIMTGMDVRYCESRPYRFLRHQWDANWEASSDWKHIGLMNLSSQLRLCGKVSLTQITAHVEQIGPAYVELNLSAFWGPMLLFMTVTPLEPLLLRVVHRIYSPILTGPLTRGLLYVETIMFGRDVMMWNHKRYESKPQLVKEDRGIVRHRRWYNQFYSEHSKRFSYQRDTLDW